MRCAWMGSAFLFLALNFGYVANAFPMPAIDYSMPIEVSGSCKEAFKRGIQTRPLPVKTVCRVDVKDPKVFTAARPSQLNTQDNRCPSSPGAAVQLSLGYIEGEGGSTINVVSRKYQALFPQKHVYRFRMRLRRKTGAVLMAQMVPCTTTLPEIGDPGATTCSGLKKLIDDETLNIRSCLSDSDCGQALHGIGCGCSESPVARHDADATTLYGLLNEAGERNCPDLIPITTCVCRETNGYVCKEGLCSWSYPESDEPSIL